MKVWTRPLVGGGRVFRAPDNPPALRSIATPRWKQIDVSEAEWSVITILCDYFIDSAGPVYFMLDPPDPPRE